MIWKGNAPVFDEIKMCLLTFEFKYIPNLIITSSENLLTSESKQWTAFIPLKMNTKGRENAWRRLKWNLYYVNCFTIYSMFLYKYEIMMRSRSEKETACYTAAMNHLQCNGADSESIHFSRTKEKHNVFCSSHFMHFPSPWKHFLVTFN